MISACSNISKNNILYVKTQKRKMSAELWERTSFKNRELLSQDEDQIYEYKEYSYPVKDHLQESMRQVLCSYLNTKGGYLFIGVTDSRHVVGIQMNPQQRDEFKRLVQTISTTFFPKVDMVHDPMIHVSYIPVKNQLGENLAGRFVIRVTVQQGDVSTFYTYQNPQKEIVGYERMDARKESYTYPKVMEQVQLYAKTPKIRAPRLKIVKPEEITDVLVPEPQPQVQEQPQPQKPRQVQQVEQYLDQQFQKQFIKQKGKNKNKPHHQAQQQQPNKGFVQLPKLTTKGKGRSKDQAVVDKHIQREVAKMQLEQQGNSVADMVNQKLAKAASLMDEICLNDTYQANDQNQLLNIKKFLLHHIDSVKKPIKARILNTCSAIDEIFLGAEILELDHQPKNTIIQSQFVIPRSGGDSKKKKKNKNKYRQDPQQEEQLEKVELQEEVTPQQTPMEEEKVQPQEKQVVKDESDDTWEDEEHDEEVEVEDGEWEDLE